MARTPIAVTVNYTIPRRTLTTGSRVPIGQTSLVANPLNQIMSEYKQNTTIKVPVKLQDSTGIAKTGIAYTAVTVTICKSDGTIYNLTMSDSNWSEITSGAFAGLGLYHLTLSPSDTDITGDVIYAVSTSGAQTYTAIIEIVAFNEADTYQAITGRWKIEVLGDDANRLILYDTDNTTILKKYDLKDSLGNPSVINPFERIPV